MMLYLDDDIASPHLLRLLTRHGHNVQRPLDVGLSGKDDSLHLTYTVRSGRILITRNYDDFQNLHNLVLAARGHHPGVWVVRKDNDPRRDLKFPGVVRAVQNLLTAGVTSEDSLQVLNHWR